VHWSSWVAGSEVLVAGTGVVDRELGKRRQAALVAHGERLEIDGLVGRASLAGRVVTASFDRTARVWDTSTGEPLTEHLVHRDTVLAAGCSPDGVRVVTAGRDNTARSGPSHPHGHLEDWRTSRSSAAPIWRVLLPRPKADPILIWPDEESLASAFKAVESRRNSLGFSGRDQDRIRLDLDPRTSEPLP